MSTWKTSTADRFVRFQQRDEGGIYWVRASLVASLVELQEGERTFTTIHIPSGWNPTVEMTPKQVIELLFGEDA